jgi:hypothetical protein
MSKVYSAGLVLLMLVFAGCQLASSSYATGSVVDEAGDPVKEARVVFEAGELFLVQFSDDAGNYKIENLEEGDYVVSASAQGCRDLELSYVYSGGNVEMDLAMDCS